MFEGRWKITEEIDMKKFFIYLILFLSSNSVRSEIINLECTTFDSSHSRSLIIDTQQRTLYNPFNKETSKLEITSNEFRWTTRYVDGYTEHSINRFSGIETARHIGGYRGIPATYKCEIIKNKKF